MSGGCIFEWNGSGAIGNHIRRVQTDGSRIVWEQTLRGTSDYRLLSVLMTGGAPIAVGDSAVHVSLRDGVLVWLEIGAGAPDVIKASALGITTTLADSGSLTWAGAAGGDVIYSQDGKWYSWNVATGVSTFRLQANGRHPQDHALRGRREQVEGRVARARVDRC